MSRRAVIRSCLALFAGLIAVLLPAVAAIASTAPPTTRPAAVDPAVVQAMNLDGREVKPLADAQVAGVRGVVFLFVSADCPISNGFAPEINRIASDYGRRPGHAAADCFEFYLVHVDADLKPADARKHAEEYALTPTVLMDGSRRMASRLGANVTPEAIVVLPGGTIQYRGRINDLYADYGRMRAEPTRHDLRLALDAVRAGKPVVVAETRAIGCPIE